jgi:hypothetical protein
MRDAMASFAPVVEMSRMTALAFRPGPTTKQWPRTSRLGASRWSGPPLLVVGGGGELAGNDGVAAVGSGACVPPLLGETSSVDRQNATPAKSPVRHLSTT